MICLSRLQEFLRQRNVYFETDADIERLSYVRIGGDCPLTVYPDTEDKLIQTVRLCESHGIPFRVLGRMTNVLPPDGIFDKVIVKTDRLTDIWSDGGLVYAQAGVSLPFLASHVAKLSLSGIEELSGIPGSIGGAVFMNAGAFGREICEVLLDVRVLDTKDGKVKKIGAKDLGFSYRHSDIGSIGVTVLGADLQFESRASETVFSKMRENLAKRRQTQPVNMPSLGSTFKRIQGKSAAELIDLAGLKGVRVGGAVVSKKHAGFIVNEGGASSKDYKMLVKLVKERVFELYGIRLSEEIEYL